jgi:hexosaminidase
MWSSYYIMKTLLLLIPFLLAACAVKEQTKKPTPISIIPKPVAVIAGTGELKLDDKISIMATDEEGKSVAELLHVYLKERQIESNIVDDEEDESPSSIKLQISAAADSANAEGYDLSVNANGIAITASSGAGLFYGVQTLLQLIPEEAKSVPYVDIEDRPRFEYRGLHLDVGRHMFPTEFIKKYIDLMARHKFNRFHWHLTEDQGWRIEIKKYPKLQEISAFRKETVVGRQRTATRAEAKYDGKRYGGFYTQEEIKDIVNYASERFITVIPEIELPGHAMAALAAYPNLGCTGGPYEVATSWGIFTDIYCGGKEDSFMFLQDVLDEVINLFPGKYIHIGGDEAWKDKWKTCRHCQRRIQKENLKDEHGLQSYFIQRIEKYLNSKGKQIIGWDEILEGGLAPNATVMSWRGEEGGIAAAKQNHDVIMTPSSWVYFDYAQDTSATEPLSIGHYLPLSKVYQYEPVPPQLTPEEAKRVLGVQANVWTEYMKTPEHVEYMVYPRASALAEVAWSPKDSRAYDDFLDRMKTHLRRLETWNVNYAKHIQKEIGN